jgi:hypothetical protein
MPVLARDLIDGALVVPGELGGDGVASDWWGSEWPLGGSIDGQVAEPFSAEPDHPIEVGDLDAMPPGPALAERLAAVSPCDVGDAELVEVIAAAERLARWSSALQVRAIAELARRPACRPAGPGHRSGAAQRWGAGSGGAAGRAGHRRKTCMGCAPAGGGVPGDVQHAPQR